MAVADEYAAFVTGLRERMSGRVAETLDKEAPLVLLMIDNSEFSNDAGRTLVNAVRRSKRFQALGRDGCKGIPHELEPLETEEDEAAAAAAAEDAARKKQEASRKAALKIASLTLERDAAIAEGSSPGGGSRRSAGASP